MVGSKGTDRDHDHDNRDHHLMDGDDDDAGSSGASCSICLDLVADNGVRSVAKLQCGHEFHLDCIGSAFNMKGAMQCPNCRKVEKGQWLFANGSTRSFSEFSMEDGFPDEDFYGLSYSEMPFRVHWCPFGDLTRVGSSFEEMDSPSTTYHDLRGHHAVFTEHTAASSYIAYVGPMPPTTSRSSDNADDPNFGHHWNGLARHNEIFTPHPFPAINIQYHSWGRHSPPFSLSTSHVNNADPASILPHTLRSSHIESDATRPRSFAHPLIFNHGSISRVGSSFISSAVPRHPSSSAPTHERIQLSHGFHHQQQPSNPPGMPSPIVPAIRRFDGPRGLPAVVPAAPQPDQSAGFYVLPSNTSSQNLHEAEAHLPSRFQQWERERLSHIPVVQREAGWGSFHQSSSSSESGNRSSSFWPRHSS